MKTTIVIIALLSLSFSQKLFAQDSTQQYQLSRLLNQYFDIKDALVASNPTLASAKATEFIKTANSIDYKLISEGNINALLKDASPISEKKDLKVQREHFANLSSNMVTLAKSLNFSSQPIYQAYCPMKKANWLSREKEIRNPYYGNAMLTCGEVTETITPRTNN